MSYAELSYRDTIHWHSGNDCHDFKICMRYGHDVCRSCRGRTTASRGEWVYSGRRRASAMQSLRYHYEDHFATSCAPEPSETSSLADGCGGQPLYFNRRDAGANTQQRQYKTADVPQPSQEVLKSVPKEVEALDSPENVLPSMRDLLLYCRKRKGAFSDTKLGFSNTAPMLVLCLWLLRMVD